MTTGIITLTTDFGLRDAYVGAMKGVILSIAPQVRLVDLSHRIPPQDVAAGAFVLYSAYRSFPAGTVHVAVVDPGVGSARRGILVETPTCRLVGPDNGLFSPICAAEPVDRVVEIRNPALMLPEVSSTFHGRDVFAPAAAHLCRGVPADAFGPTISDPVQLPLWDVAVADGEVRGRIVHVDRFGNGVTGLSRRRVRAAAAGRPFRVVVGKYAFDRVCRTYADVPMGEALVLYGSQDMLEVSVNCGNAAETLGIRRGDEVRGVWE